LSKLTATYYYEELETKDWKLKTKYIMQAIESKMKEVVQEKWNKRPLIISGPCSAETRDQVVETAVRLGKTGKVDIMRAGIWKPRTRPGSFEGIGAKGLPWLQEAKS